MKRVQICKLHLYADNTVLYFLIKVLILLKNINFDIRKIHSLLCRNKLSLNVEKTFCMLFGTGAMLSKYNLLNVNICGKRIFQSNIVKYLGMHLDTKFKNKNKIRKVVSFSARLRHFISESNLKMVYI